MEQFIVCEHRRKLICALPHLVTLKALEKAFGKASHDYLSLVPPPEMPVRLNQMMRSAGLPIGEEWDQPHPVVGVLPSQHDYQNHLFEFQPDQGQYTSAPVTVVHIPNYLSFLTLWMSRRRQDVPPSVHYFALLSVIVSNMNTDSLLLDLLAFYDEFRNVEMEQRLLFKSFQEQDLKIFYRTRLMTTHILVFKGAPAQVLPMLKQTLAGCDFTAYRYAAAWYLNGELNYFDDEATIYRDGYFNPVDNEQLSADMLRILRHRKLHFLLADD